MTKLKTIGRTALTVLTVASMTTATAAEVEWYDGTKAVTYSVQKNTAPVVGIALQMFASDMEAVTGRKAVAAPESSAAIRLVELDKTTSAVRKKLERAACPSTSLRARPTGSTSLWKAAR